MSRVPRALWLALAALALLAAGCLTGGGDPGEDVAPSDEDAPPSNRSNGSDDDGTDDDGTDENGSEDDGPDDNGTDGNDTQAKRHPPWASPEEASVRPGAVVETPTGSCTSNFVFTTPDNATVLVGVAAHCFAESPDAGDGCDADTGPLEPGVDARVAGASKPGTLVYSSWWTMQDANETSDEVCRYNDFALVVLDDADRASVSPAVEAFGGPTGLASAGDASSLDKVLFFGSSPTRPEGEATQANEGYLVGADGWRATMYAATPGVPGDSGSGVLTRDGQALGVLSTVIVAPFPGANGVVLLEPALDYAASHGTHAELATWEQLDEGTLP